MPTLEEMQERSNNFTQTYNSNYNNVRNYTNNLSLQKSYVTITTENGSYNVLSDVTLVVNAPTQGISPQQFSANVRNAANTFIGV